MATNGHNNQRPFVQPDGSIDILGMLGLTQADLLNSPGTNGLLDFPGPSDAASMQNVVADSCGDDFFDWTGMPGGCNSSVVVSSAPASIVAPSSSSHHHQDAGTSTSSSAHPITLDCSGCQILRQVVHSNGLDTAKLCIHGVNGLFYHATVDEYPSNSESMVPAPTHKFYIDFMGRDYAWVKQYLVDYAQLRASRGYVVVHDSVSDFHDVLCTSMTVGGHADGSVKIVAAAPAPAEAGNGVNDQEILAGAGDDDVQPMLEQDDKFAASGPSEGNDAVDGLDQERQEVRPAIRSRLSIQRKRISKLELRDISRYFHITLKAACKELDISETALKNVCRNLHIKRWPYRNINRKSNH